MKVLYVGLQYNYGKQAEGFSYEYMNIGAGFRDCHARGLFEVAYWSPDSCSINSLHLDGVDAIFHVAFNEHLDLPEHIAREAILKGIPVIQWDCDSSWRFHNWILPRKNRVSHFVTTHSSTIAWYKANGMNVIKSQWGGSPLYGPQRGPYEYDASFVGQKHGQMPNGKFLRSEIIDALLASGIDVHLFGNYWDGYPTWHGYQPEFDKIIDVFNTTRVNINLSNPWHHGTMPQIKGRHFEIPQCQAFQITTPADDLTSYFEPEKEIVIVNSIEELVDKTKFYINPSHEREKIAEAGYRRMQSEHQWSHRLTKIFKEVGL